RAARKANPLAVDLLDDDEAPGGKQAPGSAAPGEQPAQDPALELTFTRLKDAFGRLDHFTDGYLAGEGGKTLVVNVQPANAGIGLEFNQRLYNAVTTLV